MDFHYQKDQELSFEQALALEWLETNGLGGYASSTLMNCNTRKYHGLLVTALKDPAGKYVLLSKIDDHFSINGQKYPLTAHQYQNAQQGESFQYFEGAAVKSHPLWVYQFGEVILSKEILLLHEENTLLVKYKILKGARKNNYTLDLRPLLAFRDFHALAQENGCINAQAIDCYQGVKLTPYQGMPAMFLQTDQDFVFHAESNWYKNFFYSLEKERGFAANEDLFAPGFFTLNFSAKNEIVFAVSLQEEMKSHLSKKWQLEIKRRATLSKKDKGSSLQRQLKKVARSFWMKDLLSGERFITAGYHWFLSWGRDTMISLPGLTLHSGLEKECFEVLKTYSRYERDGFLPNYIGSTPEQNAYNSVDASLWFVWAVQQYYLKTHDLAGIAKDLWPVLKNIFKHYSQGTAYNVRAREDGLLVAGSGDNKVNLTWMDGMVNGEVVVKRDGLQVEINALWYNLLCFLEEIASVLQDDFIKEVQALKDLAHSSFREVFWHEHLGYLKDFVDLKNPENPDCLELRPNQIFAVSLPYTPLAPELIVKVVHAVRTELFTNYGLRTLAPSSSKYLGNYAGGVNERDAAYHNGTVWPWLLGAFTEALLRVVPTKKAALKILKPCLDALEQHLPQVGIGSISEVFSGDAPHLPGGCISQAWSAAEVLRMTYLLGIK
jgi:predicted glycogen debranching enzyme